MLVTKNVTMAGLAILIFPVFAMAQSIGVDLSVLEPGEPTPSVPFPAEAVTQSADSSIVPVNSVACSGGGQTTENGYLRRFSLTADHGIVSPYEVDRVEIGIENINPGAPGACQDNPVAMNIFSIAIGDALTYANMTLIESNAFTILGTADAATILSVDMLDPGSVDPATHDLVVEFEQTCSHSTAADGGFLFVGSNNLGESGASYLRSASCGLAEPTATGAIGQGQMQIVMAVYGSTEAPDDATFTVTKDFTDGNPAGVDVTLDCFQGLPITQTQTVSEAQNVVFTVQDFAQGELDCNLTESGSSGYSASYEDGDGASAVNCSWQDLEGGSYDCRVTNTPDSVEVTVSKDWVIEGESTNYIDPSYYLELVCNNEIVGGYSYYDRSSSDDWYIVLYNDDDNGTSDVDYFADVIPNWDGGTDCYVSESHYDSAIESSNNCSQLHINIVEDETDVRSCTVTNSVFFEGIPSLNQYGLAILALLMLSVGFVGFRRFV